LHALDVERGHGEQTVRPADDDDVQARGPPVFSEVPPPGPLPLEGLKDGAVALLEERVPFVFQSVELARVLDDPKGALEADRGLDLLERGGSFTRVFALQVRHATLPVSW